MLWLTDESDVTGVRDDTVIFDRDWNMLLVVVVSTVKAISVLAPPPETRALDSRRDGNTRAEGYWE